MRRHLILLTLCLSFTATSYAQDIHFSQFYENAILRNPALTGIFSGDFKVGGNYRTQWSSVATPFRTFLISAESRILVNKAIGDYLSYGVAGTFDKAGATNFSSMQLYGALNYNKSLEDKRNSYLSVGFTGGYLNRSIDISRATFSTQYVNGAFNVNNPSQENLNNLSINNYDVGAGISLNSSFGIRNSVNYYAGFAAYHLNKPKHTFGHDNGLVVLRTKFVANAGFNWNIDNQFGFITHFNYSMQGAYRENILGVMGSWQDPSELSADFKLYAGLFYRANDAIIPTFKVDYEQYSLTMSYDLNTSSLTAASSGAGGFEMSLYIRGNFKNTVFNNEALRCPRFEHMMPGSLGGGSAY